MDKDSINDDSNSQSSLKALAAEKTHYRQLFESTRDGILVIDADTGKVLDANPSLVGSFGYPRQEILDKFVWELGFLKNVFSDKVKLEAFKQKDYFLHEELPLETVEGSTLDVEIFGSSLDIENQKLIHLSLRVIQERKETERKLQESEQRFRQLIEEAPIGIGLSQQGKTVYVNPAYLKMFGFETAEELIGASILDQITPPYRAEIMERAKRQEQGLSVNADYDIQGLRKDGSEFPFQAVINCVELVNGPGLIGYFTDVSKREQAEKENQRLRDASEISSRLAVVGEMAAGIAL